MSGKKEAQNTLTGAVVVTLAIAGTAVGLPAAIQGDIETTIVGAAALGASEVVRRNKK